MKRATAVLAVAVIAMAAVQANAGEREDGIVAAMRVPADELAHALATSPWRDDPLFLAAVAQNPAATSEMLDAIARRGDRKLHEKLYGTDRLLGTNRKGLAVMRLVARHPNVTETTLVHLAASPNEYVINSVLMNPKTPEAILRRYAGRSNYLYDWGIGYNPRTPPDLLTPLASSANEYTRAAVAQNAQTPGEVLTRLAGDPQWHVRRGVAMNPSTPVDVVRQLAGDSDERVRRGAELALKRRGDPTR
jgi:hypothetical protein